MSQNTYEAIFILDERRCQDGGKTFIQEASERAEGLGATIKSNENMGRRHLSKPINKRRTGLYWCLVMDLPSDKVTEYTESYKLDRAVMRLQVLHYQPQVVREEEPAEA